MAHLKDNLVPTRALWVHPVSPGPTLTPAPSARFLQSLLIEAAEQAGARAGGAPLRERWREAVLPSEDPGQAGRWQASSQEERSAHS